MRLYTSYGRLLVRCGLSGMCSVGLSTGILEAAGSDENVVIGGQGS